MTKVYFAGKIKSNDFINEITNVRNEFYMDNENFDYIGPCLDGAHGESYQTLNESDLFALFMSQIDRADAVFCYIDGECAQGAAFELGRAYAKNIPIYLYFKDESTGNVPMQFSFIQAARVAYDMTAKEAWNDFSLAFKN